MDYAKRGRADALAAQFVAGTMRGPARRRFTTLLAAHPALKASVFRWQERVVPMAMGVDPVAPPARVWERIQAKLFPAPPAASRIADQRTVKFWRLLTAGSLAMAMVFAVLALKPAAVDAPILVVLSPQGGSEAARPQLVASFARTGGPLVIRPLSPLAVDQKRALQLWAIPAGGKPRSLGLIAPESPTLITREVVGADVTALAVSVEPSGGSPTGAPTGPVILTGALSS